MTASGEERRKSRRMPIQLTTRVQGRDPSGAKWEEITKCEDTSAGGVALVLDRRLRIGQVLHLTLPLPARLRQYDLTETSYRVYGLVRSRSPGNRYGVMFLGKHPPRGADSSLPSALFLMPGDPRPLGADRRGFEVTLRLEAEDAPGGIAQEERTFAEDVKERSATAKTTRLPVLKGAIVTVEEYGGEYRTRAEIESVRIGRDGIPHLGLAFLDEPVPERLLHPAGGDEASGS